MTADEFVEESERVLGRTGVSSVLHPKEKQPSAYRSGHENVLCELLHGVLPHKQTKPIPLTYV